MTITKVGFLEKVQGEALSAIRDSFLTLIERFKRELSQAYLDGDTERADQLVTYIQEAESLGWQVYNDVETAIQDIIDAQ